jgi:hypothetical protein
VHHPRPEASAWGSGVLRTYNVNKGRLLGACAPCRQFLPIRAMIRAGPNLHIGLHGAYQYECVLPCITHALELAHAAVTNC